MSDVVDKATRSRMMSGIGPVNTRSEVMVRSLLHRRGFRFRLHATHLPGRPDIVLPKHRVVVLMHGCFWHMHGCHLFKWPKSNVEFWRAKLHGNSERDGRTTSQLRELGWRVLIIWECALRGPGR